MKSVRFPHFSRIFSAPLVILSARMSLWVVLIGFLSLNLYGRLVLTPYWQNNMSVLVRPFSSEAHISVATNAWNAGNWQLAKNELLVAQSLSNVLGTSTPLDLLRSWEEEPKKLKEQEVFWQTIAAQRPDYRDGFIQLAAISYQLNDNQKTVSYLDIARTLDPNFPAIQKLAKLLATDNGR